MKIKSGPLLKRSLSGIIEDDTPCRHRNGTDILCRISAARIGDSQDHKIVTTYEDITDHKRAEDNLKESERRWKDIINFLPDPTFVINNNGEVIAWNRAIEMMTRIKAADILGKGNHEYALPFFGQRRPILIDLVLTVALDECHIEDIYENLKRQDHMLVGESFIQDLEWQERLSDQHSSCPLRLQGQYCWRHPVNAGHY